MPYAHIATIALILFLIPIGIMLETAQQLMDFRKTLEIQIENQLQISRDTQQSLNMTQSIIIASVKQDKIAADIRRESVSEIERRLDIIITYWHNLTPQEIDWPFERFMPYQIQKREIRVPLRP